MRIASQNRTCSVNFCQVYLLQKSCEIFAGFPDGSTKILGRYKTISRTEKVFDEINKSAMRVENKVVIYYMPKD